MPSKRGTGGRAKRPVHARRASIVREPGESTAASQLPSGSPATSAAPTRPQSPNVAPRPSMLAGVRRTTRASGPALVTDYNYVISDLKRIGILAGGAMVLLIGLTFVVR